MYRDPCTSLVLLVAVTLLRWTATGSSIPFTRCSPSSHICEGRCPGMPPGAVLPPRWGEEGLCLKDSLSGACVCWMQNPPPPTASYEQPQQQHLQTLFRCEVVANGTVKHVMCLPPPMCFPPDARTFGCMIVLQCPCRTVDGDPGGRRVHMGYHWHPVVAVVLRSKIPVPALAPGGKDGITEKPQGDVREFSVKHLLFLLAFVVAPLLCWCLLTFFHEGKCRKKRRSPESEPMPTERVEEVVASEGAPAGSCAPVQAPTAPKFENPPAYGEALDQGECCPLAVDCGPPPSYEDAVRDQSWQVAVHHRIQEV